jgi:hypothetical protein
MAGVLLLLVGCGKGFELSEVVPLAETVEEALPAAPQPALRVSPDHLDLGQVPRGDTGRGALTLRNLGQADLAVSGFLFTASTPAFSLTFLGEERVPSPDQAPVELDPPLKLSPGAFAVMDLAYRPLDGAPANARVVIFSNDPRWPEGLLVEAVANHAGVCLSVSPPAVKFGGKAVGTLATLPLEVGNCSAGQPLVLTGLDLAGGVDGCAGEFCLSLPDGAPFQALPTPEAPLTLLPGDPPLLVDVAYTPVDVSPTDAEGLAAPDLATLLIRSNAFVPETQVDVSGFGAPEECPTAVLALQGPGGLALACGEEVEVQTRLSLDGQGSFVPGGKITAWEWHVQGPAGYLGTFVPSASFPSPAFDLNAMGKYVFSLDVWDEYGRKSCTPAVCEVFANTQGCGLHVQLTWASPNDPDPFDEGPFAGTDLDLHLAHPNAGQHDLDADGAKDPWFDPNWDVFWFYTHQNWGSLTDSEDDGSLDLDDVDGWGPENANLCQPEPGRTYHVGVNYWDDHGYGMSYVTVRVYLFDQLVFAAEDVPMVDHELCWIADVQWEGWPGSSVSARLKPDGSPWCTLDYHHPQFYQP